MVYKHVDDTMNHFNHLGVVHWDVINEMIDQGEASHQFYIEQSGDENFRGGYNVKLFLGLGLKPYTHFLEDRAKALAGRLKP